MIEELKIFFEAVNGATTMAAWLAGAYIFAYAMTSLAIIWCVGYCINVVASKWHDYGVSDRTVTKTVIHEAQVLTEEDKELQSICITLDGTVVKDLLHQIKRIRGKHSYTHDRHDFNPSSYIHKTSVEWLEAAINDKERDDLDKTKEE